MRLFIAVVHTNVQAIIIIVLRKVLFQLKCERFNNGKCTVDVIFSLHRGDTC